MPGLGACECLVWAPANAWFGRLLQMRWVTAGVIPSTVIPSLSRDRHGLAGLHPSLDKLGMTMPGLGACECLVWAPANAWFGRLRMPGLGACECLVWAPANAWFGRLRMPGLGACECLVWAPATDAVGNRRRHPEGTVIPSLSRDRHGLAFAPVPRQARDDNA